MVRIASFVLIALSFMSCKEDGDYWENFQIRGGKGNSILSQLDCDSIIMENIHSSGFGNFECGGGKILYLDKTFKFIFSFDHKGNKTGRYNGLGQGPNEFLQSNSLIYNKKTNVVLGNLETYYLLDSSFNITKKGIIEWGGNADLKEIKDSPKPSMSEIYEIIEYDNFPCLFNDSLLLVPVNTEHFKYNGFISSDYYKDSHIFALLDLKKGNIESLQGKRSPEYLKYKYLPNFDFFHFDCSNDKIYINYEIDSVIYVLDKKFKPVSKFGYAGTDMNCNYKPTNGYDVAENRFLTDREIFGYYSYLKFIKETKVLFRTYTKGERSKDGMQIYDYTYNLVGNVEVPKGFRVIGYCNGRYFAECTEGLSATPMYILGFTL